MDSFSLKTKPITISVVLSAESNELLKRAAKMSGHSKRIEATLRLTQHLKSVPELTQNYWEILGEEKKIE